jgi:hypothetical protein
MVIEILDGGNGAYEPTILEGWELTGCYLNKVTYQGGDYKSNDPLDVAMTISYDNAIQTSQGGNNPLTQLAGRTVRAIATGG